MIPLIFNYYVQNAICKNWLILLLQSAIINIIVDTHYHKMPKRCVFWNMKNLSIIFPIMLVRLN